MGNIIIPRNRIITEKPPSGSEIDFNHHLAKGIVGCWLFNEGSGDSKNLLSEYNSTMQLQGDARWGNSQKGKYINITSGGSGIVTVDDGVDFNIDNYPLSMHVICKVNSSGGSEPIIAFSRSNSTYYGIFTDSTATYADIVTRNTALRTDTGTTPIVGGDWVSLTATFLGSSSRHLYLNGKWEVSGGGFSNFHAGTDFLTLGRTTVFNADYIGNADYIMALLYNRKITYPEARALHENPYQFIVPYKKRIYFVISEDGEVKTEATPNQASITIAVNSPTITITKNAVASPLLSSVSVNVNTPTTKAFSNATASPSLASISLTVNSPTTKFTKSAFLTGGPSSVVKITVKVFDATASTSSSTSATATPSLASASFTVGSPTIRIAKSATATCSICVITITIPTPTASTITPGGTITVRIVLQSRIETRLNLNSRFFTNDRLPSQIENRLNLESQLLDA